MGAHNCQQFSFYFLSLLWVTGQRNRWDIGSSFPPTMLLNVLADTPLISSVWADMECYKLALVYKRNGKCVMMQYFSQSASSVGLSCVSIHCRYFRSSLCAPVRGFSLEGALPALGFPGLTSHLRAEKAQTPPNWYFLTLAGKTGQADPQGPYWPSWMGHGNLESPVC